MKTMRFAGALGMMLAAVAAPMTVFAWPGNDEGRPEQMGENAPEGYYIWHNEDGWHLRTHGPGDNHEFTARLHTDGVFADVDPVRLENADSFAIDDAGHTMVITFHTFDRWDGVDFRLRDDADCLRFNLKLEDKEISTSSIYLGAEGHHPAHDPFRVCR